MVDENGEPFGQHIELDGAVFEHDVEGARHIGSVRSDALQRLVELVDVLDLAAIDQPARKGTVIGGTDITWTVRDQTRTFKALTPDSVPVLEDLWMRFAFAVASRRPPDAEAED